MGRKVNVSEVIGKSKLNGFMYGVIAIGVIMILFDGYDTGNWVLFWAWFGKLYFKKVRRTGYRRS